MERGRTRKRSRATRPHGKNERARRVLAEHRGLSSVHHARTPPRWSSARSWDLRSLPSTWTVQNSAFKLIAGGFAPAHAFFRAAQLVTSSAGSVPAREREPAALARCSL